MLQFGNIRYNWIFDQNCRNRWELLLTGRQIGGFCLVLLCFCLDEVTGNNILDAPYLNTHNITWWVLINWARSANLPTGLYLMVYCCRVTSEHKMHAPERQIWTSFLSFQMYASSSWHFWFSAEMRKCHPLHLHNGCYTTPPLSTYRILDTRRQKFQKVV